MNIGSQLLSEILPQLEGEMMHSRVTLSRDQDGWLVRRFESVVGKKPPHWKDSRWIYKSIALLSISMDGQMVAEALSTALNQDAEICVGDIDARVPKLQPQVFGRWRPGMARRTSQHLVWPTIDWTVNAENQGDTSWYGTEFLAADGCPTFASMHEALHAFNTGIFSSGTTMSPSEFALIQFVQDRAWLHKVKVGTTAVDVWVKGESIADTNVQLIDSSGHNEKKVGSTGRVRLPLLKSGSDDARLFLTSGLECLDYRVLGFQYPYSDDARHGVEYEVIDDPGSEISRLIAQGEGQMLEYKSELPADAAATRKLMRTIAAFANGNGGEIVFGMDPDEVTVVGLIDVDHVRERDRLTQLARDHVTPGPVTEVRSYEYEGKILVVMSVAPGSQPPYARTSKEKAAEYFIRRGANTYPARPDEIRESVLSRATSIESPPFRPR